jgi:hypothetical protein
LCNNLGAWKIWISSTQIQAGGVSTLMLCRHLAEV